VRVAVSLGLAVLLVLGGCSSAERADMRAPEADLGGFALASPLTAAKAEATRASGFGLDKVVLDNEGRPVTDDEVQRLLDWRVAVPAHSRLALLEARAFREYYVSGAWGEPVRTVEGSEWAVHPADPEDVTAVQTTLAPSGRFESVTTVPSLFLPARADLGRCRYAAARANSDLVLLYAKATRVVRYHNKLANFYPLIVGLLLPGEETVVVTRAEGALVDARTGRVFAVAVGSSRGDDASSPLAASTEGRQHLLDATERDAVIDLARNLRADLDAGQLARPSQERKP
jgi:hypothetical protein